MELHFSDECGGISIHALLAESDRCCTPQAHIAAISIHALLAESDPVDIRTFQTLKIFLSTLSLRRATLHFLAVVRAFRISIHALLAESD